VTSATRAPGSTTVSPGTVSPMTDPSIRRKIIVASMVGTTIEFYDFYIYATAAVAVFPYLFFPDNDDPTVKLFASFATFGLAFLGRPLGSVVFGHFGDRIGRKATLVVSLLTMGIATFIIGLLPTYGTIGLFAPALLALMRFSQGLGLGGEWSGAALLATESASKDKRAWAAMWPQLGAPIGFLVANGSFLILATTLGYTIGDTSGAFMSWGWRIPFLFSSVMVIIGLWVRFSLEETPVFKKAVESGKRVDAPLTEVFKTSWVQIIQGTLVMVSCYTLFYLITTWILSYGIGKPEDSAGLGIPYEEFLVLQLISVLMFMGTIPFAALGADKRGRRKSLLTSSIAMLIFAALFPVLLNSESANKMTVLIFLIVGMGVMGCIFSPMSAVLPELFPTNVRYTGSGIAYNLASILGAAIAPFIATWLVTRFSVDMVGLYLAVTTVISMIAIWVIPETKHKDMSET